MSDTQKGYKGREDCLYGGTNYNNIMPKKPNNKVNINIQLCYGIP